MLLTIGMIVKNEEKYLEQCLSGLKPILENVDSELIIADTGSTDRTVEIAKQFTDNVFYFEWINDFAAARNSTLEKARGEWYMFVDGDEIFRSCDEIIHFFNSGEYKKYNSASFNIRNYLNVQLDNYADFNGPRMTRILPNTRFMGEIHESLNTYGAPFKILKDTADHYGYVYDDENSYDEKQQRNAELLLKRYEDGEREEGLFSQLYDCFIGKDPATAEKYMEEGIELCKKNKSIVLITLYVSRTFTAYCNSEFEKALQYCDEYFNIDKEIRPREMSSDGEMHALKAFSLYNLNRYDEAIDTFIIFFDVFKRIQSGKLLTYDSFMGTTQMATDKNFVQILNAFCRCCVLANKYNLVSSYLQSLPIAKYSLVKEYVDLLIVFEIDLLRHFDYADAGKYYRQLDSFGKKLLRQYLSYDLYQCNDKDKVLAALMDISKNAPAVVEKVEIYQSYFHGKNLDKQKIYDYANKYGVNDDPDLFMIAMDKKYDIAPLFRVKDFDMKLCVYMCFMKIYGFTTVANNYTADCIENVGDIPDVMKFFEYCMKTVPIYRCPKPGVFMLLTEDFLIETYAKLGERYAAERGRNDAELQPEIRAAMVLSNVIKTRSEKNYKSCFAGMKEAVSIYPGIAAPISEYQKKVIEEFEQSSQSSPQTEMQRLAAGIKRNINKFIVAGDIASAKNTLDQYKQIAPNDPDIKELYNKINNAS